MADKMGNGRARLGRPFQIVGAVGVIVGLAIGAWRTFAWLVEGTDAGIPLWSTAVIVAAALIVLVVGWTLAEERS